MRLTALLIALAIALLPSTGRAQRLPALGSAFTLRPGDQIELYVSRDPRISGTFTIDERGRVVLPILGARGVTEASWPMVRDSLLAELGRELRDPAVRLTPMRRVFVLGFVERPGSYFADPTVPVAGVIALAGGATTEGDLRRLRVVRDGAVVLDRVSIESADALADVRSGDQIYVGRRSWGDRNAPFIASAAIGALSILISLSLSR